jgi:hypothetical protein
MGSDRVHPIGAVSADALEVIKTANNLRTHSIPPHQLASTFRQNPDAEICRRSDALLLTTYLARHVDWQRTPPEVVSFFVCTNRHSGHHVTLKFTWNRSRNSPV